MFQLVSPFLTALRRFSSTGLLAWTGSALAGRTLTAPAAGITVSNGDGVAGNPTLALANDLAALEALAGTGLVAHTAAETYIERTITGTSPISVANGGGVAAAPAISLLVNVDHAFTAAQSVVITAAGPALTLSSTDSTADTGPDIFMFRDSSSPAANDALSILYWLGRNSIGTQKTYANLFCVIADPTSGSEDVVVNFSTIVAGAFASRLKIGGGLYHINAAGGDKGNNTINFGAVYDDNVLLTCPALQREYLDNGRIDLAKWDALVPDNVEPERKEFVPLMEMVAVERTRLVEDENFGGFISITEMMTEERPQIDLMPIFDAKGNGLDAIEIKLGEEVTIPEKRTPRQHVTAHLFQSMVDEGFDPRNPFNYIDRLESLAALPGMPTEVEWEHGKFSLGELASRKWLALEFLALAVRGIMHAHLALAERVTTIEAKLAL